jgi:hypothetical protein
MFDTHHLSVITFLGSEKNKATVLFAVVLPVYIKYYWMGVIFSKKRENVYGIFKWPAINSGINIMPQSEYGS